MRRFLLPLSLLMFLFSSCEKNEARVFTSLDLNTICSITVYEAKDEEFVQGAFDLMKEIAGVIERLSPAAPASWRSTRCSRRGGRTWARRGRGPRRRRRRTRR